MRHSLAFAVSALALFGAGPVVAQQTGTSQPKLEMGTVSSQVLTIDRERLFRGSAFGKRVAQRDRQKLEELAAENRMIEAELASEEQRLTEQRTEMGGDAFRALADAFDAKVQDTKKVQLAKERELSAQILKEEESFLRAAVPVLEQLMLEAGAAVILERRAVFVGIAQVDITDRAIALLDETIGSGENPE